MFAEAEENNLGEKALVERWARWDHCSLCKQEHHGVVRCALGWACWKTYVGRPERDGPWMNAMTQLGNGLNITKQYEDALVVREAVLSTMRRLRLSAHSILAAQTNLANTYDQLGRHEDVLRIRRDAYTGFSRLYGEEHSLTILAALALAGCLFSINDFQETKSLLLRTIPVAQRVLEEGDVLTLKLRSLYADALFADPGATLDDTREAVNTLEDTERTARRFLGSAHPDTAVIERHLRCAREILHERESPDT